MIADCLERDFEVLVLTNAMLPMQRIKRELLGLNSIWQKPLQDPRVARSLHARPP